MVQRYLKMGLRLCFFGSLLEPQDGGKASSNYRVNSLHGSIVLNDSVQVIRHSRVGDIGFVLVRDCEEFWVELLYIYMVFAVADCSVHSIGLLAYLS